MHRNPRASDVITGGGFVLHSVVGRIARVGLLGQSLILAGLVILGLLLASYVDGSLLLPGRDVGLLEHPAIWTLIGLQVALPLVLARSLMTLLRARTRLSSLPRDQRGSASLVADVLRFARLEDKSALPIATAFYCAGLAAFVWNTYQNQRPGIVVPFDFWDSTTFKWGFWSTRLFKLYLFAWFLPYVALVHTAILVVTLRSIRKARLSGRLKLAPFHPDAAGGLGFVPELIATPVIVALLITSVPLAAVFIVHRAADVTPLIGLGIVLVAATLAYGVPTLVLRQEIVAMKAELVTSLRAHQEAFYLRITEGSSNDSLWPAANESFDYFEKVCTKVQTISNYPHLRRLLAYAGVVLAPSVVSALLDVYGKLGPIVGPLLKTR